MSDTNVHRVVGNLLVGTSHFFVDTTTNRVGVNTSSPSASLDIATGDLKVGSDITIGNSGTITAANFSGNGSGLTQVNSDQGSWVNGASSNIHLAVSTDKVGIGVDNPQEKLELKATNPKIRLTDNRVTAQTSGLELGAIEWFSSDASLTNSYGAVAKIAVHVSNSTVAPDGDLRFSTGTNGTLTERVVIKEGGDVGIGVDIPQNKLVAAGGVTFGPGASTTTATYHTGTVNIIGGGTRALLRIENNNGIGSPGIIFGEGGGFTEDTVPTIKKVQGTNKLAIMTSDNVGVGTTNPQEKLHVNGSAQINSVYRETFTGSGGTGTYIYLGRFSTQANGIVEISSAGHSQYNTNKFEFQRQYNNVPHVSGINSDHYLQHRFFYKAVNYYDYDLWHYRDGSDWSTQSGTYTYRVQSHSYSKPTDPGSSGSTECIYGLYVNNEPGDTRVGIGVRRPSHKLEVAGTIGSTSSGSTLAHKLSVHNTSFASPVVNQIHLALRNNNLTHSTQTQADRKSGFWLGQYNDQNYTDGEQFIGFTNSIRFIKCNMSDYNGPIVYDSNTFNAKINGNLQTRIGRITDASDGNPINFTGQHRCVVENFDTNLEGLIVSANKNEYCSMSDGLYRGLRAVTINEALPVVTLSRNCMDKSCFGVISLSEDPENDRREDKFGCFVTEFEKEEGDERIYINSVGEGAIWVTNINGELESGDYITTSTIPGYGQKQNDDILHNYTVAKITMDCDFQPRIQNVKKIKRVLAESKSWYKIENTEIKYEEFLDLPDDKKYTHVENGETKYMKAIKRYSKEKTEEYNLEEVIDIMKNVLDENGRLQWEDLGETERAYKVRYLFPDGTQISKEEYTARALADEKVFIAAFVGCTYHCG